MHSIDETDTDCESDLIGCATASRWRAVVMDAQATLGEPDWSLALEAPPSERLKHDLRDSGLTAVSMTLSVGSTGDRMAIAIRKIAIFDEKIASARSPKQSPQRAHRR